MTTHPSIAARLAVLVVALASVTAAGALPVSPAVPAVPSGVATGFDGPETAIWDAPTGAWYFTNNGGGSIAKLVPGGEPEIVVTGLASPQGVVIHNRTFVVADGRNVVLIDMADPTQRQTIDAGGTNDLDVDPATGDIYVGSISGNSIKRIHNGVVEDWFDIPAPDGVAFADGEVWVNTLGLADADSGLFRIDVATKQVEQVVNVPFAAFDGLERDGDGWLMTDFAHGTVYRVNADRSLSVLAELTPGSAQLGLDPATRTIAVPNLLLNHVVFLTI